MEKFICDTCGKGFSRKYTLNVHKRIHTSEKPFVCDYDNCKKSFKTSGDLTRHKLIHSNERKFPCATCKLEFKLKFQLEAHYKAKHLQERNHHCPFENCQKSFKAKLHLQNHLLIHKNEKPLICGVCKSAFREYSTLSKHMNIHGISNEAFVCSFCWDVFRKLKTLKAHMWKKHNLSLGDKNLTELDGINDVEMFSDKLDSEHVAKEVIIKDS